MAGIILQLPSCGVAEEDSYKRCSGDLLWKKFLREPSKWFKPRRHVNHEVTRGLLWMDNWGNPYWVHQELGSVRVASFVASLRACTRNKDLIRGTSIHHDLVQRGLLEKCSDAVVTMYAICGEVLKAKLILDTHKSKDVTTWTALIAGYARQGQCQNAIDCLGQMQCEGIMPNAVTYVCILKACAMSKAADRGKQIHDEIARQGFVQNNIVLGGALVDMYAKCGDISEARRVLEELPVRNVVSWNALIAGYAQEGESEQALGCLEQMEYEGILPNAVTYVCVLKACATIKATDRGKQIHREIARQGLLENNIVLAGALVDMYAKCGDLSEAHQVLKELPFRDVVAWSALITGYVQEGLAEQALNCFEQMQCEGILPNSVTYVCAIKACAMIRAADKGKQIHDEISRQQLLHNDIVVGNALVDMHSKCGDVSEARRLFEELPCRDVFSWSALIAGYAQEGQAEQALKSFHQMDCEGILPNAVTCACVLKMCSHQGLVEEGQALFANMSTRYGVKPSLECYTSMIDLLGRAGHLDRAVRLIQEMPFSDYTAIWHALLAACCIWLDVNVGEWAFEQAVKFDTGDEAAYVLMANIYAAAGMEEKAKSMESMRIRNKAEKNSGYNPSIDLGIIVHEFSLDDTKHGQRVFRSLSSPLDTPI